MKFKEDRQTKSDGGVQEGENGEVMGRGDGTGGDGGCAPVHAHARTRACIRARANEGLYIYKAITNLLPHHFRFSRWRRQRVGIRSRCIQAFLGRRMLVGGKQSTRKVRSRRSLVTSIKTAMLLRRSCVSKRLGSSRCVHFSSLPRNLPLPAPPTHSHATATTTTATATITLTATTTTTCSLRNLGRSVSQCPQTHRFVTSE